MTVVWHGIVIGLIATVAINVWAMVLNRLAGMPYPNRKLMGRWAAHLASGKVFHESIATARPIANETAIGWAFHISVGAIFGAVFALIVGQRWLAAPTLLPALIFGIVTVGFGWFLMQPGMGSGWAGSRTPRPWQTRIQGLLGHTVFGVALWLGALLLR
jgi:hypothetical protein